jgi:uncharacterized cupredoxin-like copper-binding protein
MRRITTIGGLVMLTWVTVSCGAGGTAPPDPASPSNGPNASSTTTVDVTLTDFEVVPEPSSTTAGPVTFEVITSGVHSFSVLRTELPADDLPTLPGGNADITSSDIEVVEFTAPLPPGESTSVAVDLSAGSYALICNLVNHYSLGMHAAFTVA